jgi:UDP-N-acetylglucosamine 2-epimerase (non-hydrolysing)
MRPGQARLLYVVGTRPSAVALGPVLAELRQSLPHARHALVHDSRATVSDELLAELRLPPPDYFLDVSSGSAVSQTTAAMERIERVVEIERPHLILLADESAPTLSAALTALKLNIPTARLDAGLRSFDRQTPEEVNRVIMDTFADLLFASCEEAATNLGAEGIDPKRVHVVGSPTADLLTGLEPRVRAAQAAHRLGLAEARYLLVLLREPTLFDPSQLEPLLNRLGPLSAEMPVILPAPARASKAWATRRGRFGVRIVRPVGYVDQLSLATTAASVITDSGFVQDETAFIGTPCLSLREKTERVAALARGTSVAIGRDRLSSRLVREAIERARVQVRERPPLWDGRASSRLAAVVAARLSRIQETALLPPNPTFS